NKIAYPEVAATSQLLLELATSVPQFAIARQISAREEAKIGADWEWWLTDGNDWLGLLVQAKIVNTRNGKYSKFNYRPKGSPKAQLELLMDAANANGLYPIVLCYNFQAAPDFNWNCRTYDRQH